MKKILACLAALLVLAGCADSNGDAAVSGIDKHGAHIGQMPDGFNNWAAKCDGPNMVYTIYHSAGYGAIAVAPNDPRCVDQ